MRGNLFSRALALIIIAVMVMSITACDGQARNSATSYTKISYDEASERLSRLYDKVKPKYIEPSMGQVDLEELDTAETLPPISKYIPQVRGVNSETLTIFSSTEKATYNDKRDEDVNRWLLDMGEAFNKERFDADGIAASVQIWGIDSGLASDYISTGEFVPDVFTPSNEIWGDILKEMNVPITLVDKGIAKNTAGIVVNNNRISEIEQKYGAIAPASIAEGVINGDIMFGYTNPNKSSTGRNFLLNVLTHFGNGNILSPEATDKFTAFQNNIPFVAYTTLQMTHAAKNGTLDAFVLEYQQFQKTPTLKANYTFYPFGLRHDSPVYTLGTLSARKSQILDMFLEYCKTDKAQKSATDYGFNGLLDYVGEGYESGTLQASRDVYKEKKFGTKNVYVMFVSDVSGSMAGEPMQKMKEALLASSKAIPSNHHVGLVTFSDDVNIVLDLDEFNIHQRSLFVGAVEDMVPSGGTAMYDGIITGMRPLLEAKENDPTAKIMLFALTDGDTRSGHNFNSVKDIFGSLGIPIYTVGFNGGSSDLTDLSLLNEAASINADNEDVAYKLVALLDAEL